MDAHRQAAHQLRDEPKALQIFRLHPLHQVAFLAFGVVPIEPDAPTPKASLDDLFESVEGAPTNEENVAGVDLDVFLLWMLPSALGRNAGDGPLKDL